MDDWNHAVDVWVLAEIRLRKFLRDVARCRGGTIHSADQRDVVSSSRAAVLASESHERTIIDRFRKLHNVGREFIARLVAFAADILNMNPLPGPNIDTGCTDWLAKFSNHIGVRNIAECHFVIRWNRVHKFQCFAGDSHSFASM